MMSRRLVTTICGLAGCCSAWAAGAASAAQDAPPAVHATVAPITPPFRFDVPLDQGTIPTIVAELTRSFDLDDDQAQELDKRLRIWRGRMSDAEAAIRQEVSTQMDEGASLTMRLFEGDRSLSDDDDEEARQAWLAETAEIRKAIDALTLEIRTVHNRRQENGDGLRADVRTEFLRATYRHFAPALTGPWRADLASRLLEERRSQIDPELWEAITMSIDMYRIERERLIETAIPIGRRAVRQYGTLFGDERPKVQYREAQDALRNLSLRQMQQFKSLLAQHPSTASV